MTDPEPRMQKTEPCSSQGPQSKMQSSMKLHRHRNLRNLFQYSLYAHARRDLVRMPVCVVSHALADPGIGSGGSSSSHKSMVAEGLACGNLSRQ